MSKMWAAVAIESRGSLLDGYHATVLNKAVYSSEAEAADHAARQSKFEEKFANPRFIRYSVVYLGKIDEDSKG